MASRRLLPWLFILAGVIAGVSFGVIGGRWLLSTKDQLPADRPPLVRSLPPAPTPTPRVPLPVTFSIPRLAVEAPVEYVGVDVAGRMDVPKNPYNVAWYEGGPRPGEPGNAVVAGHLDSATGPAVFYRLKSLKPGDTVRVAGSDGQPLTFQVTVVKTYPVSAFPMDEVFGTADTPRLNLITCEGVYNRSASNYSHRVVVYTELMPS